MDDNVRTTSIPDPPRVLRGEEVPEPDPQPIAWQVRDRHYAFKSEHALHHMAVNRAGDDFGVHAVMPAGWVPAGTPRKADR